MTLQHPMARADRVRLEKLLGSWRDSLIDLSFRNRLLNYQRRSSSVGMDLVEPGLLTTLEGLTRGCGFAPVEEERTKAESSALSGSGVTMAKAAAVAATGARPIDTPASRAGSAPAARS
ncbi:hypothetical protein [Streptomyces sp. G-G2]|uniref:hypothetical protein n=1 Tax=Streptomyces sp. G-G2 TaxID=3046201 RepID=UPI0024B8D00B|nr:hypothetical protein [Streptomyces sp. G-G2]MDJ0380221.1 hypothetical protein [Streptomyces sp. G-G2]